MKSALSGILSGRKVKWGLHLNLDAFPYFRQRPSRSETLDSTRAPHSDLTVPSHSLASVKFWGDLPISIYGINCSVSTFRTVAVLVSLEEES